MKKKLLKIFIAIILLLVIGGFFYLYPKLPILNGYAAKMACSCTFVANKSLDSTIKHDLNFFPISLASVEINDNEQSASASFLGLRTRTAYFNPQTGCALMGKDKVASYKNMYFETKGQFYQNDSLYWPYSSYLQKEVSPEINLDKIKTAVNNHFSEDNDLPIGKNRNTRAVVVVYKDQLIYEQYASGYSKDSRMIGWSMSKSVTSALVGILVKKGLININKPVGLEEWKNDERKEITWDDLLKMKSGLDWEEDYTKKSGATKMLYESEDMVDFAINREMEAKVGEHWEYSSGTSNILSGLIRKKVGDNYWAFPYNELFGKIGANSFLFETDASGNFIGSSYAWATARDWAKFGLLYLHGGNWNGEQILPQGWAAYSGTPIPESDGKYGAHFWTKNSGEELNLPSGSYLAQGYQEQRIFIIPKKDLVIVRLGLTNGGYAGFGEMVSAIIESIP